MPEHLYDARRPLQRQTIIRVCLYGFYCQLYPTILEFKTTFRKTEFFSYNFKRYYWKILMLEGLYSVRLMIIWVCTSINFCYLSLFMDLIANYMIFEFKTTGVYHLFRKPEIFSYNFKRYCWKFLKKIKISRYSTLFPFKLK